MTTRSGLAAGPSPRHHSGAVSAVRRCVSDVPSRLPATELTTFDLVIPTGERRLLDSRISENELSIELEEDTIQYGQGKSYHC